MNSALTLIPGKIINTLSNSRQGFHLEISADMGFGVGDTVWISREPSVIENGQNRPDVTETARAESILCSESAGEATAATQIDGSIVHRALDAYTDRLSWVRGHVSDGDELDAMHAALVAARLPKAAQHAGPVAYLHDVVHNETGETDAALSFSALSFSPDDNMGYRSVGHVPLYRGVQPIEAGDAVLWRACEAYDPIGWQVMGGDSRADFKANMRRALEAAALAHPRPSPDFDFVAHLCRQREWSGQTFGPGSRAQGVVDHIRKELLEIEADPGDLKEWIDVVILALDGAWRSGAQPEEIIDTLVAKQTKNEGRVWPDWRTADPTKAIEHDRSHDAPAPTGEQAGEVVSD